ncbi:MAG: DUF3365 domain-containing protein [Nitrospirales bacterium]|nr:DUF3365 domain-containing protein [Nitrospirales bacterium]
MEKTMGAIRLRSVALAALLFVCLIFTVSSSVLAQGNESSGIPARSAADYIHSVVTASRAFYAKQVVERLGNEIALRATENWEEENTLPLPAQFLKLSAENSSELGIGLKIRLIGLNPINQENAAVTDLETLGLRGLSKDSDEPFTLMLQKEGTWTFQAIYPDVAISQSCVNCHNEHPNSSKKDYQLGDVIGGILINVPLSNVPLAEKGKVFLVPPQIVSDYIHATLESDRYVYTEHVVKRMAAADIVEAKEFWIDENALPLPDQFLLNTGRLTRGSKMRLNLRLISQWPINFNNSPANEFERNALGMVSDNPLRPYLGRTRRGRTTYFQAVYPDFAVSDACVDCHNSHPKSSRKDHQLDDLMGGMIISFPVKK